MHNLNDLCGQPKVVARLKNDMLRKRLAQGYLFVGSGGVGKFAMAKAFAASVLCHQPTDGNACGLCPSCLAIKKDAHLGFMVFPPPAVENKKINIAMVRQLEDRLARTVYGSDRLVIVLRDMENISIDAANALLKTLEEPPDEVHFILTVSDRSALLPTIVSRMQVVYFTPLPISCMINILKASEPASETPLENIVLACEVSGGSLDRAKALIADQKLLEIRQDIYELLPNLAQIHAGRIVMHTMNISKKNSKDDVLARLNICQLWFADALALALAPTTARKNSDCPTPHLPAYVASQALHQLAIAYERCQTNANPIAIYMVMLQEIARQWKQYCKKHPLSCS